MISPGRQLHQPLPAWSLLLLVVLIAIGIGRILLTYEVFGETFDEGVHIAAGMELVDRGRFTYEPKHPDSMIELKEEAQRQKLAELMATGYNIPAPDALGMLGDAHSTNWAENHQFLNNQNTPTNFERVWNQAYYLYRRIGSISHQPVSFDQVHVAKDGRKVPVEIRNHAFQLEGRTVALSIARDLSEQRRAREALEAAQRRQFIREISTQTCIQISGCGILPT